MPNLKKGVLCRTIVSAISHAENVADANLYKRIEWDTGKNKYITRTCTVLK